VRLLGAGKGNTKLKTFTVTFTNRRAGLMGSRSFEAETGDGEQEVGETAAALARRMINEAGYFRPGDCICLTESEGWLCKRARA
jgi:hypothetical protein